MITLRLTRYYGSGNITKSILAIDNERGESLMECEARETRFYNYKKGERIIGASYGCLGEGEYALKPASYPGNPVCLRIYNEPSRRGHHIVVGNEEKEQCFTKTIRLGIATEDDPKHRRISQFPKTKELFQRIIYDNYLEEFLLVVSNEGVEIGEE